MGFFRNEQAKRVPRLPPTVAVPSQRQKPRPQCDLHPADPVVVRLFAELRFKKKIGSNQEREWQRLVHYLAALERFGAR